MLYKRSVSNSPRATKRQKDGGPGGGSNGRCTPQFVVDDRDGMAHNWEEETRSQDVFDDGTMTFFWQAHTLTCLVVFGIFLVFELWFVDTSEMSETEMARRGVIAVVATFMAFGIVHMPDGPFKRPHPAFWRLILCCSIVYELGLIFLLFQNVREGRRLMKQLDDRLGVPLPERTYEIYFIWSLFTGGNCKLYDATAENPFHNVLDKFDMFVPVHFFGWWIKTLILRDWWLCMVFSILFELMEYTFEHQLPNFSECWWDHWILDALICNTAGILFGMKTLKFLSMREYHWQGLWKIKGYRKKLMRVVAQFGPYDWRAFDWRPTASLKRWCAMLLVIAVFIVAELNNFFLKFVLWVPPDHLLCGVRAFFFLLWGACGMREVFQYLDDPQCKKLGPQSWMTSAIIFTEVMVVFKFDWALLMKPLPSHMKIFWSFFFLCLLLWTVYKFYICTHWPLFVHLINGNSYDKTRVEQRSDSPQDETAPIVGLNASSYTLRRRPEVKKDYAQKSDG